MTLVNTETGEIVEQITEAAARQLTERIRIAAANYTEAKAKVLALVDEAKSSGAHLTLGYKSWSAYLSDVLSDEPLRLARDDQRELTVRLADEGMSSRAISPIVGASRDTVQRDIREATGRNLPVDGSTSRATEGLDGRTRLVAVPTAGRARPRPVAERSLNSIALYADKAAREAQILTADQLRRVRPEADHWTASLRNSIEALQRLVNSLNPEETK